MADETPGRVAATLAEIRERYRTSFTTLPGFTTSPGTPWAHVNSADDVPLLVAAVEAALKLADNAKAQYLFNSETGQKEPFAWDISPEALRAAITATLAGEEAGDG
jgi:hypothetical protein